MTIDIDAIRKRADAYDLQGDADAIFDEDRYYRSYATKAHWLARTVPALLAEIDRLRMQVYAQKPVIEAAEAWAEDCEDSGKTAGLRNTDRGLYDAVEQYRVMDLALDAAHGEQAEVA